MIERQPRNRLALEASPYLLQHASNPVDWWPWCQEALAEAMRRDVPILLSIGYSACHWCHVMERESFEDPAIAARMNALYVNVKVDREERPDLDQIYQLVVQLMGRSGGWPLTVFLTPSTKPFFGGTYFPPEDRYGMPGFPKILEAIAEAYRDRREEVDAQAIELTRAISEVGRGETGGEGPPAYTPGPDLLARTSALLLKRVDATYGGFGTAPKFPNTMPLELVLRRGVLEDDERARSAALLQLEQMRRGGIWDHLGGGFHRYSTDERWIVPHFEKMLYDNALLLRAYVDAHRAFEHPPDGPFVRTAMGIARYIAREMTDPEGGFYASQDADSEGDDPPHKEEGRFFVWDEAELRAVLLPEEAEVAIAVFGVTPAGNFEDHGRPTFKTVLHEARAIEAVAATLGIDVPAAEERLARATSKLFTAREQRPRPFRDEKVLTSWTALMLGALAEAGAAFDDPDQVALATRAFDFLSATLVTKGARGLRAARLAKKRPDRTWLVKGSGYLDDHAYLANAALDLYEATGNPRAIATARGLADGMIDAFYDPAEGFFFTPKDGEALLTRSRDPYDNAVPSGASMACRAFLRLGALVDEGYAKLAEAELVRLAPAAVANPFAYGQSLCEIDRLVRGSVDVVLVGPLKDPRTLALARTVFARWLPNRTVAWLDASDPESRAACALLAEGKEAKAEPVAYVCRGRSCSLPVREPSELARLL